MLYGPRPTSWVRTRTTQHRFHCVRVDPSATDDLSSRQTSVGTQERIDMNRLLCLTLLGVVMTGCGKAPPAPPQPQPRPSPQPDKEEPIPADTPKTGSERKNTVRLT